MVSVIVPVYNSAPYLEQCVRSVLSQTYGCLEAIIVDDGCTDGSLDICRRLGAEDCRVRVISQPNGGVSAARNAGLSVAAGEWVAFVDGDDAVHPRLIERLMDIAEAEGADMACSAFCYGESPTWKTDADGRVAAFTSEAALEDMLYQRRLNSSVGTKLFRKHLFDGVSFAEGKRYEDLEILPALFLKSGKICFVDEVYYFYRARAGSFIRNFTPARLDVLQVTASIERLICLRPETKGIKRLKAAALDRRFAANFNMFALCTLAGHPAADECWAYMAKTYKNVLFDRRSRLKNKLGAAFALIGRKACEIASKIIYA